MSIKTYDPKQGEHTLFVKCLANFEEELAQELRDITEASVEKGTRGAHVTTNLEGLYRLAYNSRLAQKILLPIASFKASSPDQLYEQSLQLPWSEWMEMEDTYAFQSTVHSPYFEHSQFAMQRMRDGLNDQFKRKAGARPSVDTEAPSRYFHLHIDRDQINLSLDATGLPLHKRGYRKHGAGAPLSEVLAASLIAASHWKGEVPFYDPMCGSGTLGIEAAMRAAQIPPQILRPYFAFEEWPWHDDELWDKVKEESKASIDKDDLAPIVMGDIVPNNVDIAKSNMEGLDIEDLISFETGDFLEQVPHWDEGVLYLNPPYGEKLGSALQAIALYGKIGTSLKHSWGGHEAWIISSNQSATKRIGLKPSHKREVYNGALKCKLLRFELFKGKRAEFLSNKKAEQ